MIVLDRRDGWLLIQQPDHAASSAEIASAWKRPSALSHHLWSRFVEAVRHHDDGWYSAELRPSFDSAHRPCDFMNLPSDEHVEIWSASIDIAADRDPLAGLLVARHAHHLYSATNDTAGENGKPGGDFVSALEERMKRLKNRLSFGSHEEKELIRSRAIEQAVRLMAFFDGISLMLLGAIEPFDQTRRLAFEKSEASLELKLDAGRLGVAPWPFDRQSVTTRVPSCHVKMGSFGSESELATLLGSGSTTSLEWTLTPLEARAGSARHGGDEDS